MTIVAAVAAFAVSAVVSQIDFRGAASSAPEPQPGSSAVAPSGASYETLLAELDGRIEGLQKRAGARTDDWLIRMGLASLLLERAGLSNRLEDFERVQAVLDEAFTIAPAGSGPLLVAARYNYAIHRLDVAEQHLDMVDRRAVPRADDLAVARVLRAEIAVQRGQYDAAFAGLTAAGSDADAELALYHAKTGNPTGAEALLTAALTATHANDPRRRAWLRLQLGILAMDHGELLGALQRLREADAELAGWWLVQEHVAEVHNRRAEHDKAIIILEGLVRQLELPQHMDALASLYRHTGATQKADEMIARAAARWDQQLARLPEAAMGHSLEHELEFGTPQRALELALANHKARPGGDAQVLLARAYLQAGQPAEALAVVERTLASPYRTARLHDVAARAYTALGRTAEAEQQAELRLAINPQFSSNDHSH